MPAWSFAAGLGRSAASWVPSSLGQNSTQHPLAGRIKKIQRRLWDLLPVVRNHVYHPAFAGSFSLKAVLPALVPNMTYDGMEVADGTDAGLAWESLIRGGLDRDEHQEGTAGILPAGRAGAGQTRNKAQLISTDLAQGY